MWRVIPLLVLVLSFSVTTHSQEHEEDDWPMYGRNLHHTFSNPSSAITPENVATLQLAWRFPTGDAVSASPTVVGGVVYIGAWDGFFYALDARTGQPIWQFQVDCQRTVVPVPPQCLGPGEPPPERFFTDGGLITASAAVVKNTVYFAAGKTVYSVRAADGKLRWKRVICGNPDEPDCAADADDPTRIFSSPVVFQGAVFVGASVDEVPGYRGGFLALDAATGAIRWRFEVDPVLDAHGRVIGGLNRGCGNVWSSAAIDAPHRLVFFGTSDCQHDAVPPYHEAVVALETRTGRPRWVFRPRQTDTCDFDFGATPNVIDLGPHHYVGIGGKDGTYYVLERLTDHPDGQLVWATNVVFGGMAGGFLGAAAFDGARLFSATGVGDYNPPSLAVCDPPNPRDTPIQEPSLHAFTAARGEVRWQQTGNQSFAPTTLAAGVVLSGTVGLLAPPALQAYDARTGQLLASFPLPGSVNAGATPVGTRVFVGSGNSSDGAGSAVHAFTLP
jgi:outer membrane protein assembly factor BamB